VLIASGEDTVIEPVYAPAANPAVLKFTVIDPGAVEEFSEYESQFPPEGVLIVADANRFSVPAPELLIVIGCDGGFEPPTPPLALMFDGETESVGGGTMKTTGTVSVLAAEGELMVTLP
jgi:hypothetical protein